MPSPSLHFAPYAALAAQIADRLAAGRNGADPLAAWPEGVIVASRGVAHTIGARLLKRFPAGVAGLELHSLETLAQRIVNAAGEYPRPASDAERRLAMRTAVKAVDDPMFETRGAAAMLERTYRDIRDSGLTLSAFADRTRRAGSLRNADRLRVLIRACEEYERLIRALGATDPADILLRAAALVQAGAVVTPQILAGFYDMTGAQLRVIRALQEVERLAAIFVPADLEDAASYAFATPFVQAMESSAAPLSAPSRLKIRREQTALSEYRTREDEVRGICAEIAVLLEEGVPAESIGVAARALEPYDVHLFERFARAWNFTVSAPVIVPLTAHRIGRALTLLVRLRERDFPRSDVLEIVRAGLRTATSINADKADLETRQAQIAGGSSAVLKMRSNRSYAVGDYIALVEELETLTQRIDASFLARAADLFRVENDSDLAALAAVDDLAALFTRAEAWNRPADAGAILDAIEQCEMASRAEGEECGRVVWLGDVMRFRGRTFDHLFAIRMQDGLIPQRRNEDPLLPDSHRRALGLREIGNGRDEEQLLFALLRAGGRTVRFSYAASDGFGKALRRSSFLRGMPCVAANPKSKIQTPTSNRALQLLTLAGTEGVFDGYISSPVVLERARVALQSISPTQLEDFGECPQKFLFKHILGVREIDDPEREVQINHREKGSIDHRILERFYRAMTGEEFAAAGAALPRLTEGMGSRLDQEVDAEFDALEDRAPAMNRAMRAIERRATKRNLREFVTSDLAELIAGGLFPRRFEYRFGAKHRHAPPDHPEPFIVDTGGVALRVEGTIDRIDEGPDRWRIVDYKSGKALRHKDLAEKTDRGVRLQLALYAMAVADFFGRDPATITAAIKPIAGSDVDPRKYTFSLSEKHDRLRATLGIFVQAILRGAFPAFPNESDDDFNSCKYCPVSHSCRTKHDAEERRAVLRHDEPRTLLEAAR
jgi:ATP-dependent helicase/DNAse subunit B